MTAEHRSTRRQRQAQATRDDILTAARRLFAERGYTRVTVADIAGEADVAVQTMYASVGSKRQLVLALVDTIDREANLAELVPRVVQAPDAATALAAGVHVNRVIQERTGDIIAAVLAASVVDADAEAAASEGLARHRDGAAMIARRLDDLGGLRADVDLDAAATTISVLTSAAVFKQLRTEFALDFDDCERWIAARLAELLLK